MPDDQAPDLWIAQRLKEIRHSRGLTLTALAQQVNMSAGQLSRIENGERQPSVGALIQLARAYGVSLSRLVGEETDRPYHLVRSDEGVARSSANGDYVLLSGPLPGLEAVRIDLNPASAGAPASHRGEEWVYLLSGKASLLLGEETIALQPGDAVHFDAGVEHGLRNELDHSSQVLLISTDPFSGHARR
ncbi:helix-turn-helix transcriptional regulator [Amycolatopsis sp. H6(2020)]|nr:helix-turn-helix transcriptional regulator [Amycolatopsis sp. H6(2020)]